MRDEDFNIRQFDNYVVEKKLDGQTVSDFFRPHIALSTPGIGPEFNQFEVTDYEEGRIDLVLLGMYGDVSLSYADLDIILHINGIDNPLSIMAGDILIYPPLDAFEDLRYMPDAEKIDMRKRNRTLGKPVGIPNKSTRQDKKRAAYLDNVAFPPTINETPRPGVRTENGVLKIGGVG